MAEVERVERASQDADRAGPDRRGRAASAAAASAAPRRPSALPGLRLPLELHPADPDGVAPLNAGPAQLGVDAEAREVSLEPLGRFLDIEVRLGGDPLDPLAAHAESAVLLDLDAEPVAHRLDPVDDDPGRVRRRAHLGGVRQQIRDPRPELLEPGPVHRGDRDDVLAGLPARRPERRPRLDGGRLVELVEDGEDRLLEQRRIVGPELVPDHLVIPGRVAARAVHQVEQDARPFDVTEEGMAQTGADRGALDEAGHIRDRGPPLVAPGIVRGDSSMTPRFGSSVVNG